MSISVVLVGQDSFTNMEKTRETLSAKQFQWLLLWSTKSCREQKRPNYKLQKPSETGPGHPESSEKDSELFQLISCEVCTNTSTGSRARVSRRPDSEEVLHICLDLPRQPPLLLTGTLICFFTPCPLSLDKIRKILCIYRRLWANNLNFVPSNISRILSSAWNQFYQVLIGTFEAAAFAGASSKMDISNMSSEGQGV